MMSELIFILSICSVIILLSLVGLYHVYHGEDLADPEEVPGDE